MLVPEIITNNFWKINKNSITRKENFEIDAFNCKVN